MSDNKVKSAVSDFISSDYTNLTDYHTNIPLV